MADIYRRNQVEVTPRDRDQGEEVKSKISRDIRNEVYRIVREGPNPLQTFIARPKNFKFETELKEEETILLLRRHPITQLRWFLMVIPMLIAPWFLGQFPLIDFLPFRFQFIVVLMWYLLTFAFILEKFLSWYFDVNIITDERVLDIDFYNLIYKEISDAEIEKIEDVTLIMAGVLQTIFNYGTISIQTAAEIPQLLFEDIPNPALVVQVLKKMQMEEKQETLEGRVR